MAQKKLLFVLSYCLLSYSLLSGIAFGASIGKISFVENQSQETRQINSKAVITKQTNWYENIWGSLLAKWNELQRAIGKNSAQVQAMQEAKFTHFDNPYCLRVFISTSMTNAAILDYARAAENYNARLVLKGLPGNSWLELAQMVRVLQQELGSKQLALEIDDTAFAAFNVHAVPTIVLSQEERIMDLVAGDLRVKRADQVVGNIGLKNALELFAENGDMADIARNILFKHSGLR